MAGVNKKMESAEEKIISDIRESLPEDLKRGVLSEDGIWNMLERNRELSQRIGMPMDKCSPI